jgi:ubiquinone biosynthesis protein Coq4
MAKIGDRALVEVIARAALRGRRAAWLPMAPWEELLPQPLDEVRRRLRIDAPPTYREVRPPRGKQVA